MITPRQLSRLFVALIASLWLVSIAGAAAPGVGFEDWRKSNFNSAELADASVSGPLAAPSGDGVPNLLKYAMRLEAEAHASPILNAQVGEAPMQLSFQRDPEVADARLEVQVSADLETWQPYEAVHGRLHVTKGEKGVEVIRIPESAVETTPYVRLVAEAVDAPRMALGTNFWNFAWGGGRTEYFKSGVNWATVENPWRDDFIEQIGIYSVIRWMDQVPTNSSNIRLWSQRVAKTANHYSTDRGSVAYEWQIDLCNRVGADYWITVPHLTIEDYESDPDDNYWTSLAQLVKEQLDPNLNIYLEYSNESWSSGSSFAQGDYLGQRGVAMGFSNDTQLSKFYFHVYAASRLHKVFLDTFEGEHDRIKTVIAGQANYTGGTAAVVKALRNQTDLATSDPRVNPWNLTPDYFAVANYCSTSNGGSPTIRADWTGQLANSRSLYSLHTRLIGSTGMQLISYEGGQHYTTNAHLFSQNPESYDMYMEWLNEVSDYFHLTMHYTHLGSWSSGGAWGAKSSTSQPLSQAHRYRALVDWVNGGN